VFGKEAPSVTVDTKEFLPPAPKGSGDEEAMGRCARARAPLPRAACSAAPVLRAWPADTLRPPERGPADTWRYAPRPARPKHRDIVAALPACAPRTAPGGAAGGKEAERGRARARSSGGVVATSASGKIVCSNTLDDRLRIAYAQNLSSVRAMLFGITARA